MGVFKFVFHIHLLQLCLNSNLKYYILLCILDLNLPIQWLLSLGCTLNVGIVFMDLNALCNTFIFGELILSSKRQLVGMGQHCYYTFLLYWR
jgi:hypothetical protein